MGPLPVTSRGQKYVLVIVDYFTKWAEAVPLPNQEAATVARALVETIVCRLGAPAVLHSDQGRNFQSRLFREVVSLLEMSQTRTCAFNPKSDGLVERCNRTIEALLSAVVADDHSDWDLQLPFVMAAYRSTAHSTTGVTPNMMMLGREVAAPLSLIYPEDGEEVGEGAVGYVAKLQRQLQKAYEYARREIGMAVTRQCRNYDQRATDRRIPEGTSVYYHHPLKKRGLSPKFQRLWTGPWVVKKRIGDAVYEIQKERTTKVVHFDSLKPVPPDPGVGLVRVVGPKREGAGRSQPRTLVHLAAEAGWGVGAADILARIAALRGAESSTAEASLAEPAPPLRWLPGGKETSDSSV